MTIVAAIAFTMLAIAAVLAVVRLVRPGTLPDRLLGLDLLVLITVASLGTHVVWTGSGAFLDVLVVAALLGFVGTVFIAGLIQDRPR